MLISLATEPAEPDGPNEDFAVSSDSLAVLLDGASIPCDLRGSCPHSTQWFTRQLGTRIFAALSLDPLTSIVDGVALAIEATAKTHSQTCDISDPAHPSATVVVLRELADVLEYYVLGDSTLVIDIAGHVQARTDQRLKRVAGDLRERVKTARPGTPEHLEALADLVKAERASRNTQGGYWIAATEPEAALHARLGHVDHSLLRRAALLSDGASAIVDRFRLITWDQALDTLATHGPRELIRKVREAELSDEQDVKWPRSKPHDDATVIYCAPGLNHRA